MQLATKKTFRQRNSSEFSRGLSASRPGLFLGFASGLGLAAAFHVSRFEGEAVILPLLLR
jgi:hypothetical protein